MVKPNIGIISPPHCSVPHKPSVDGSKKNDHLSSVGTVRSNPYGLKTVVVPALLTKNFLEYAAPNTDQKIETFGVLCGRFVSVSILSYM